MCVCFSGPTAGLRAVRILHDLLVASKKLVAKVDAKNKLLLDNYKEEETKKLGSLSKSNEEQERKDDTIALDTIGRIIEDFQSDIDNYETIQEGIRELDFVCVRFFLTYNLRFGFFSDQASAKSQKVLQGAVIEEEKRELINSEIGKFRKTAEVRMYIYI